MGLVTIDVAVLKEEYHSLAVLTQPFAESLQACFISYYAGVGIPDIRTGSITDMIP